MFGNGARWPAIVSVSVVGTAVSIKLKRATIVELWLDDWQCREASEVVNRWQRLSLILRA